MKPSSSLGATLRTAVAAVAVLSLSASAWALIEFSPGSTPVENTGWPLGCEKVANQPGRLGYWEGPPLGGGESHFEFACKDTAEFNEALKAFAAIQLPRLPSKAFTSVDGVITFGEAEPAPVLVIHDGPKQSAIFECEGNAEVKQKLRLDWTFTVWSPASWYRLFNSPKLTYVSSHPNFRQPVAPPQIDVYIGGEGKVVWKKVKVPRGIRVIDQRESAAPVKPKGGDLVRAAVYDMATWQPISNAEIAVARRHASGEVEAVTRGKTDSLGMGEMKEIPPGNYDIVVRAKGYASRIIDRYENKANTFYQFIAMLAPEASVKGVVTSPDGKPVADVRISAENTLAMDGLGYPCSDVKPATTDKEGRFEIRGLPRGYTELRCSDRSLYPTTPFFELHDIPSDDIKIVVARTGVVRGKVIGGDGKPADSSTHVSIAPPGGEKVGSWGGSMQCKENGTFEFQGVPPGQYLVGPRSVLSIEGKDPNTKLVTVKEGQTVDIELLVK